MSFAVHTEQLNLVSSVAAEERDERNYNIVPSSSSSVMQQQQPPPQSTSTTTMPRKFQVGSFQSHTYELTAVMNLAVPTFTIQLGSVMPGFLIASYIGRNFTEEYLDGFTLASLTMNLFSLSLLQGLYSASDTLSPQAYGAGNSNEVGYLAVRGFMASLMVVVPITILLMFYMRTILVNVGEDSESAAHASQWYQIVALAIPFYSLYQVSMKFLSAQNQMTPLVVCSILSTCIVLPISLWFFGTLYGFVGTAIAMVIFQVFQSMSLLIYLWWFNPHDPSTWPGLQQCFKHAMQWGPFISYMVRTQRINHHLLIL
jgi:multidrug resistance protein, MATE family